jgi:hypothetical protein
MDVDKVLKDVPSEQVFWFNNGVSIRNIYELARELKVLNDFYFRYHCNAEHDDFANWIGGVLEDIWLSERLRGIKDKDSYVKTLEKRIKSLERRHSILSARKRFKDMIYSWFRRHDVLLKVAVFVIFILICVVAYIQYDSVTTLGKMSEKLLYLEQKDACYNSYLNQKITETQDYINKSFNEPLLECQRDYSYVINDIDLENLPQRIDVKDILVSDNKVIFNINGSQWSVFTNTSSMLPVLNHNTKAIEITPANIQDINVGDIISYSLGKEIIIHRVISKGFDENGYYMITKGDNNLVVDPERVRFGQVDGVVVALIY